MVDTASEWTLVSDAESELGASETSSYVDVSLWHLDHGVVAHAEAEAEACSCQPRRGRGLGSKGRRKPKERGRQTHDADGDLHGDAAAAGAEDRVELRRGWQHFEGPYAGFGGNTCRSRVWGNWDYDARVIGSHMCKTSSWLEILRTDETNVTELERDWPELLGQNAVVLERASLWRLEEALKACAVRTRARKRIAPGGALRDAVEYVLPVAGHMPGLRRSQTEKEKMQADPAALYTVRDCGLLDFESKLVGRYELEPPMELFEKLADMEELPVKLNVRGAPSKGSAMPGASCRSLSSRGSFQPSFARREREWMELDFGRPRLVRAVTTRARRIERRLFPTPNWLRSREIKNYRGPQVNIAAEPGYHAGVEAFFPEFELLYLRDEDGEWVSCGVHKGPRNNFEERVAWLTDAANQNRPDGVFCRRMRVRVVVHKYDAEYRFRGLSVAAFGARDAISAAEGRVAQQAMDGEEASELETVFVLHKSTGAPPKLEPKKGHVSSRRCSCCSDGDKKAAAKRNLLRSVKEDAATR